MIDYLNQKSNQTELEHEFFAFCGVGKWVKFH